MPTTNPRSAGPGEAVGRASPLYRWGSLVARRKRVVFVAWAILLVVALAFVKQFNSALSMTGKWVPSSESTRAAETLVRELPALGGNQVVLVFSSKTSRAADTGFQKVVATAARNVSKVNGVAGIQLPTGAAARALTAPGGRTALAVVALPRDEGKATAIARSVAGAAAAAATSSVHIGVTGEPMVGSDVTALEKSDVAKADMVGVPIALLVLLIVFGSLIAAGLPLLLAASALLITFGGLGVFYLASGVGLNTIMESPTIAIGLGIGIDYALFIVTRFREELAHGRSPGAAAATTTATAGRTVLVSGFTVVVALAPILLVNDPMLREIVIGPMIAITVLVAVALSLLPAVLAGLGLRVNRLAPPLPRWLRRSNRPSGPSRLTALIMRRPVAVLASGLVVLGALAVSDLHLKTGFDYGLSSLTDKPSGAANATIATAFGPGAIAPDQVVFITRGQPLTNRDLQVIAKLDARLSRDPRVKSVTSLPGMLGGPAAAAGALQAARTTPAIAAQLASAVNTARGSTVTVMTVTSRAAFDSSQAHSLLMDLRRELPAALRGTGMHALVGGATASISDLGHEINKKTPYILAIIILLALVLLGAAFRSPLVALIGLAGTMISVGAAIGLLVLVFQKGGGAAILGFNSPGFIQNWLPLMLFAILVGLSTDYQVFLISRVREEWERTGDATHAIVAGVQRSGRVILSAATIMVIVFVSFMLARELEIKELGFSLAAVVLIDAAITRRLLIPAALRLVGERAWKLPARRAPLPAAAPETGLQPIPAASAQAER